MHLGKVCNLLWNLPKKKKGQIDMWQSKHTNMLLIRIQVVAIWRFTVKNFQIVLFKFFIKEKEGGKNGIGSRIQGTFKSMDVTLYF